MIDRTRREFLADVGKGMLVASVGSTLAADLGLSSALAAGEAERLSFGAMEPLVSLMQDTPADKLLPQLVDKLKNGTDLKTLIAAGALANARTFGGQDYIGYHSFMALAPAYQMAQELSGPRQPLPVLKVLYRNTSRMQARGGHKEEILHPIEPATIPADRSGGELLQQATRSGDFAAAERTFASLAREPAGEAFNHLQFAIQDEVDVHRVVLAWRSWAMLGLTGEEQARTLLRQSVRYCVEAEKWRISQNRPEPGVRAVLPKLIDQHRLLSQPLGKRTAEDTWIERFSLVVYGSRRDQAAEVVAAALAEGFDPESVGEAISLAANRLVLCDPGRAQADGVKYKGSCHGDSVGVHASDAANAWRNIARVSNQRNTVASLIVGAYHTAGQTQRSNKQPFPSAEQLEKITTKEADRLLVELGAAIQAKDQLRACALVHRYGALSHPVEPVFELLHQYATSEDGALHAEKYYRTVREEFTNSRPAFACRHLVALARVTASEYGQPAPGYAEARRLLGV
jgi:hypothetical protein